MTLQLATHTQAPILPINLPSFTGWGVGPQWGKTNTARALKALRHQHQQKARDALLKTTRMVITGLTRSGLLPREDGWRHHHTANLTNARTCETCTIYHGFYTLTGDLLFITIGGNTLPEPTIGKDWRK